MYQKLKTARNPGIMHQNDTQNKYIDARSESDKLKIELEKIKRYKQNPSQNP